MEQSVKDLDLPKVRCSSQLQKRDSKRQGATVFMRRVSKKNTAEIVNEGLFDTQNNSSSTKRQVKFNNG